MDIYINEVRTIAETILYYKMLDVAFKLSVIPVIALTGVVTFKTMVRFIAGIGQKETNNA